MSGLTLLFWIGFLNMFLRTEMLFNVQLYFGLLLFCGFVIFDTQLIIEKAENHDYDYVLHSLELFLELLNIFVRILIILTKKRKNDD